MSIPHLPCALSFDQPTAMPGTSHPSHCALCSFLQAFTFNTFSMEEAFALLSSFNIAQNMAIVIVLAILVSANVSSMVWLGCYRNHRAHITRERSGNLTDDEKFTLELRRELKRERTMAGVRTELRRGIFEWRRDPISSGLPALSGKAAGRQNEPPQRPSPACAVPTREPESFSFDGDLETLGIATPLSNPRKQGTSVWVDERLPSGKEDSAPRLSSLLQVGRVPVHRTTAAPSNRTRLTHCGSPPRVAPQPRFSKSTLTMLRAQDQHPRQVATPPASPPGEGPTPPPSESRVPPPPKARHLYRASSSVAAATSALSLAETSDRRASISDTLTVHGRARRQARLASKEEMLRELRQRRKELREASLGRIEERSGRQTRMRRHCSACLKVLREFCIRLYHNFRLEHTLISFVAPEEDEEALSKEQIVQIFFSTLYLELAILCLVHAPSGTSGGGGGGRRQRGGGLDASGGATALALNADFFGVSLVTALTQGVLVAGLTFVCIGAFLYAYKLGNSRHRDANWKANLAAFWGQVAVSSGLLQMDRSVAFAALRRCLHAPVQLLCCLGKVPASLRRRRAFRAAQQLAKARAEEAKRSEYPRGPPPSRSRVGSTLGDMRASCPEPGWHLRVDEPRVALSRLRQECIKTGLGFSISDSRHDLLQKLSAARAMPSDLDRQGFPRARNEGKARCAWTTDDSILPQDPTRGRAASHKRHHGLRSAHTLENMAPSPPTSPPSLDSLRVSSTSRLSRFGRPSSASTFAGSSGKGSMDGRAATVDEELLTKLKLIWSQFDQDDSGAISTSEMKEVVRALELRLSDEEISMLMCEADPDGSGQIEVRLEPPVVQPLRLWLRFASLAFDHPNIPLSACSDNPLLLSVRRVCRGHRRPDAARRVACQRRLCC